MSNVQSFMFQSNTNIRTITINNEPHFVGKDVAEALGYKDTDQAIRNHVEEEDKTTRQINGSGQTRDMLVISESGVYDLVFGSKLPSAKKFKRWITKEVLPSIRKTGGYVNSAEMFANSLFRGKNMEAEKNIVVKLLLDQQKFQDELANKTLIIENQQDEINDLMNQFRGGLSIKQFCKDLNGVNQQQVQNTLFDLGWLGHDSIGFFPKTYYKDSHIISRTTTKYNTYNSIDCRVLLLTEKGVRSLYKLYKKGGLIMVKSWNGEYSHTLL